MLRGHLFGAAGAVFLAVSLVACASTSPLTTQSLPPSSLDRTAKLEALRDTEGLLGAEKVEAAFEAVRPRLNEVRFVLVPGYLTGFLEPLQSLDLTDYLEAQEAAPTEAGFPVQRASINTLESVASNAARLRRIVETSDRPVCLITHSKGGIDALTFLLTAPEETRRRVACFIAIQAPFRGSPIADEVSDNGLLQITSHGLLGLFGGSGSSLEDHRSDVRLAFLETHRESLSRLAAELPIITLAAEVAASETPCIQFRPIASTLEWLEALELRSDGLVPTVSQTLPDTPYVQLSGLDHTGAVAEASCAALSFEQRKLLTKALVAIAFDGADS